LTEYPTHDEHDTKERKAKYYERNKLILSLISMALNICLPLIFLIFGGSQAIRNLAEGWSLSAPVVVVLYLLIVNAGLQALEFPLEFYSGFMVEKKYNLSRVSVPGWLWDWFKGIIIQTGLILVIISGIYWLLRLQPDLWWIWSAIGITILMIFLTALFPVLLMPLFFKFEPLPDGELRQRLFNLAERIGTRVRGVYIWKLGDKSAKANAAVTGWGSTRRIIISDTLIESNTTDEIEVVMAHELGHQVNGDIWKMMFVQTFLIFISLFFIHLAMISWIDLFNIRSIDDIAGLPLIVVVGGLVSLIALPISNWLSRRAENEADLYALNLTGMKNQFISAMLKLGEQNLSRKTQNPVIEFLFHSHPSTQRRIDKAKVWHK